MTPAEIGWFAGLVEGEGSILVRKNAGGAIIKIGMTDEDVIRRVHEVTGCGSLIGPVQTRPGCKPTWIWQAGYSRDVTRLLLAIAPLLGERRREQAMRAANQLAVVRHRTPAAQAA